MVGLTSGILMDDVQSDVSAGIYLVTMTSIDKVNANYNEK